MQNYFMRWLAAATVALVLPTTAAMAKCGTGQLNGTWLLQGFTSGQVLVTINGGVVMNGGVQEATISQTSSCRVTYVITSSSATLRGWSDFVTPGSSRKPKIVQVASKSAGFYGLVRQ